MSIHLVGGGRTSSWRAALYGPFAAEAVQHRSRRSDGPARPPRIGIVVVVDDPPTEGDAAVGWFAEALGLGVGSGELTVVPSVLGVGDRLSSAALTDLDGLLVGGGLTPAYHRALAPRGREIRALVADGVPYLGFSAGSVVAADRALLGGWRFDDKAVCAEDNGEDLDQLTVAPALGLVPFTVDVHVAQWGNLSRLVAAVGHRLTGGNAAVGIDEDTALIWDGASARVVGSGQAWWCALTAAGVVVRTLTPESLSPESVTPETLTPERT